MPFAPIVVGPDQIPKVLDPETAATFPALSLLSCMTHGEAPDAVDLFTTYLRVAETLGAPWTTSFPHVILDALSEAAFAAMEQLMSTEAVPYLSRFAKKLIHQGRAEGIVEGRAESRAETKAQDVLTVLESRGLDVPEAVRARLGACTDLDALDRWLRRAVTVETVEALFEGEPQP